MKIKNGYKIIIISILIIACSIIFLRIMEYSNQINENNYIYHYTVVRIEEETQSCDDACNYFSYDICNYCSHQWVDKQYNNQCYCEFTECSNEKMVECIKNNQDIIYRK